MNRKFFKGIICIILFLFILTPLFYKVYKSFYRPLIFHFGSSFKWPDGEIYYTYDESVPEKVKESVEWAMRKWEKETNCIEFIEIRKPILFEFVYYIDFETTDELVLDNCTGEKYRVCMGSSSVGFRLPLSLTITNCHSRKLLLHELGHCLGLQHEHQRPDRDQYVTILEKNIDNGEYHNFKRLPEWEFLYPLNKFPYDYLSIMHYRKDTFSNSCESTIEAHSKLKGDGLTKWDIKKIQYIYGEE